MSNWKIFAAYAHVVAGYAEILISRGTPMELVGLAVGFSMILIGIAIASGKI